MAMVEAHAKFAIKWLKESLPEVQEWLTANNSTETSIWIVMKRFGWRNLPARSEIIDSLPYAALACEKNYEKFSTTTSFISPYAFVKHDYKTKQQESRPYIV